MSKGIELPINVLVIVVIAVVVLLGLVVIYFTGFNPFSGSISITSLKNTGCSNFTLNYNCGARGGMTTAQIILPENTYGYTNLLQLCTSQLGADTEVECRTVCGCGGVVSGGGGGPGPGPTCDNDGTCDPGENNANCPADCPPGCISCGWNQLVPPIPCTVVGVGNGCLENCVCNPNGCGGQCNGADVYCPGGTAPQWPEGTGSCCIVGAVGC